MSRKNSTNLSYSSNSSRNAPIPFDIAKVAHLNRQINKFGEMRKALRTSFQRKQLRKVIRNELTEERTRGTKGADMEEYADTATEEDERSGPEIKNKIEEIAQAEDAVRNEYTNHIQNLLNEIKEDTTEQTRRASCQANTYRSVTIFMNIFVIIGGVVVTVLSATADSISTKEIIQITLGSLLSACSITSMAFKFSEKSVMFKQVNISFRKLGREIDETMLDMLGDHPPISKVKELLRKYQAEYDNLDMRKFEVGNIQEVSYNGSELVINTGEKTPPCESDSISNIERPVELDEV